MVKETIQQSTPPVINYLLFYVNGKQIIEYHIEPDWTLLWYLRNSLYSSLIKKKTHKLNLIII